MLSSASDFAVFATRASRLAIWNGLMSSDAVQFLNVGIEMPR